MPTLIVGKPFLVLGSVMKKGRSKTLVTAEDMTQIGDAVCGYGEVYRQVGRLMQDHDIEQIEVSGMSSLEGKILNLLRGNAFAAKQAVHSAVDTALLSEMLARREVEMLEERSVRSNRKKGDR